MIASWIFGPGTTCSVMGTDTITMQRSNTMINMINNWIRPCGDRMLAVPRTLTAVVCVTLTLIGWGQPLRAGYEVPGKATDATIVLEHATIYPVSSAMIEDGTLVLKDGKIQQLGKASRIRLADEENVERIDLSGKHIYPGLIDADTALGLVEIDAVRATVDLSETGQINPNVCGATAFQPDSELIPVARSGGVLHTLTVPRGGLVSGQSSLMMLDGWTADEMTVVKTVGLHVNWPSGPRRSWRGEEPAAEQLKERSERLDRLRDLLADAQAYQQACQVDPNYAFDARLAAMVPLLKGEIPLYVHANDIQQIQEAVAFCQREGLKLTIVGGYDAPDCAELLQRCDVPVIVTGTHRLPRRRHAEYDEAFRIPAKLQAAGVQFCIAGASGDSGSLVQNLAQQAGTAAAFGLSREDALRSITQGAAEILGVGDRLGSLQAGQDATLIVTDGDVLEITTHVEQAYLQGRPVDLNNRHKRLWRKYQQKYDRGE